MKSVQGLECLKAMGLYIHVYIYAKAQKLQSVDISRDVLLVLHTLRRKVSLESL